MLLSRSTRALHAHHSLTSSSHARTSRLIPRRTFFGSNSATPPSPLRRTATAAAFILAGTFLTVYYLDPRSSLHRYVITPIIRNAFDAEAGHKLAVRVLKSGLGPKDTSKDNDLLKVELWGEEMTNPIGLAAGFDKNAEAVDGLFDLGFGWVEIGSVTPAPQAGNPLPRVFHLLPDHSLINRYGFPSHGSTAVLANLRARRFHASQEDGSNETSTASQRAGKFLAINLGKNKSSAVDSVDDFVKGMKSFAPWADAIVINVSSPNTPGLRSLQAGDMLAELIAAVDAERQKFKGGQSGLKRAPRMLLKLAPDLTEQQLEDVAAVINGSTGIDGVIVSNTTIQRPPGLISENKREQGGLSGPPLLPLSLKMVRELRGQLPASIPIIGCGGISSGADAIEFAKAGASCVQLYTSFGYGGPGTPRRIKDELVEELQKIGKTWSQLTQESTQRLSLKGEPKRKILPKGRAEGVGKEGGEGELDVKSLIKEAERIKGLLEKLEGSM